jgi:hypothetical protein
MHEASGNSQHAEHAPVRGELVPLPPPGWVELKKLDDIRLEAARVYRDMRSGRIATQDGTRLVYVLGQIGELVTKVELQGRIEALERVLKQRKQR